VEASPSTNNNDDSQDREAVMSAKAMTIEGNAVLVTGATRGLGQALVEEALRRGAKRVYAVRASRWFTPMSASRR
jgi:NADP-dependent 3-hydroxy acid dehydrogenase YdfG